MKIDTKETTTIIRALELYRDTMLSSRAISLSPGYGIKEQQEYENYTERADSAINLIEKIRTDLEAKRKCKN